MLVEIRSVGICGSDVHYYQHGRIGDFVVKAPMVLGHESSGVVVALGRSAQKHHLGERVALEPGVPCGSCRECRNGRYNLCRDVAFFATPPIDGALARYVVVHEDFAFELPDDVSDDSGALDRAAVGRDLGVREGPGRGRVSRRRGRGRSHRRGRELGRSGGGSGRSGRQRPGRGKGERIRTLGATGVVDPAVSNLAEAAADCDVFFDCSGHAAAVKDGIKAVRPAGTAVLIGMCPESDVPMPLARIQNREVWVTGTFRYAHTYPKAIALVASKVVDLDSLVDARFPLSASEDALLAAGRDPAILKPLVAVSKA